MNRRISELAFSQTDRAGCFKRQPSKAAASEDRRQTLWGTLRIWTMRPACAKRFGGGRERCWRTFSASCQACV